MVKREDGIDVVSRPDENGGAGKAPARPSSAVAPNPLALSPPPSPTPRQPEPSPPPLVPEASEPALCLIGRSFGTIWARTTADRLAVQFRRAGIRRIISEEAATRHAGDVIGVRADAVLDQPLIPILIRTPGLLILGETSSGETPVAGHFAPDVLETMPSVLAGDEAGLRARRPADLGASFWQGLRKREVPYAFVMDEANRARVEWRTFMGTYKGATDIVTKRLWPVPAFYATRALAPTPVTPNVVTTLGAFMVFVAFFLFLDGRYAWGLAAAWLMTFLDTVDGKLARTTLSSSKWGDIFDHGIDLVHPPFWYAAWAVGLSAAGFHWPPAFRWSVVAVILGGYVIQRLMEGIAIKWLGMEIHIWRPIDTWFREITARRNPNLVLLTIALLLGRPDLGLVWVAVWTSLCLVLHLVQLLQAFAEKRRTGRISSWMNEPSRQK